MVRDIRTLVYRLHGLWISQDFSEYSQLRAYMDTIITEYDPISLRQAVAFIDSEIQNDIFKLVMLDKDKYPIWRERIMNHKIAYKAIRTILQKNLAPKISISKN